MKFSELVNKRKKKSLSLKEQELDFYSDVANLITEARLHYGLTQKSLAEKLDTKQPAIARIESGLQLPSLSWLFKLAKALNTNLIAPKFGFMEVKEKNIGYMNGSSMKSMYQPGNNPTFLQTQSAANMKNVLITS